MTMQQLAGGLQVENQLTGLRNHLTSFDNSKPRTDYPLTLNTEGHCGYKTNNLRPEFLNMDEFIMIYKLRVQNKITELEKELAAI